MFKTEDWLFSNEKIAETSKGLSQGVHNLYIEDQSFDPDTQKYTMMFHAIDSDEKGRISWFLQKKDGTKNQYAINTLVTLGVALQGKEIGVPYQDSVRHGLVTAEVVMSPPKFSESQGKEVSYPNIYKFTMADVPTYVELKSLGFDLISQAVADADGNAIDTDSLEE